ncbi:MAG: hypothetical protein ACFFFH_02480 [Candidatus Thorarchaeota archaeon]
MVRPGRESFKRFISTIVNLLPPHIEQYPESDQSLIWDFLSVVQNYEEADYQRNKLSKRFNDFNNKLSGTDKLLHTTFLWFAFTYFSNADRLLNISKFHADTFYEYLVKHLRGTATIPGVYGLIKENVPLTDLSWEELQYETNKLLIPLTNDQLQILKTVYQVIMKEGVHALDPRELKASIFDQVKFPRRFKLNKELSQFFSLIDSQWSYRFHSPAFGLKHVFCHFQLQNSTSLKEVIDFENPQNTVLGISDIFLDRNLPNNCIGLLRIPSQDFYPLKTHLQECERQGGIIIKKMEEITTRSYSGSLSYYRANTGWIDPSPTKMRRLVQLLQAKNLKKRQEADPSFFIPPPFNPKWNFRHHPLPTEIIKLFCNLSPHTYSFSNLPLQFSNKQGTFLTRGEVGLLKQLIYNQVVQIGFLSWRLVYEFSLDLYCIKLPNIPLFQLNYFLELIPFCDIYFTENNIFLWTRLKPKLVRWVKKEFNWPIIPIRRIIPYKKPEFSHFDPVNQQWITPELLQG